MEAITDRNFSEKVLDSVGVVVVDFWAEWCGPCRALSPIIEELSEEFEDIQFYKMNVEENTSTAAKYVIRSLPTIMIFKDGEPSNIFIGARPKAALKRIFSDL